MSFRLSPSTRVLLAFACLYFVWGSTYSAIHIAGEHLSAPVVSATRSWISVALIAVITLARRKSLRVPKGEGWRLALIGLLFMSGNNMLLTWGEQMVPSGFASLIVSTMPIMVALLEWLRPGGEALNKRGWAGTLLSSFGIFVLVWPSLHGHAAHVGASRPLLGTCVLLGAAFSYAIGVMLSRKFLFKANAFVATGWEIGAAAIFNTVVAVGSGGFHHALWTPYNLEAIAYLSVFGSLFGLVSFTYLLKNVAATKVSTYAFVNPVVAVLLGVFLLHERLVSTEITGMAVILCGVVMVIYGHAKRKRVEPVAAEV